MSRNCETEQFQGNYLVLLLFFPSVWKFSFSLFLLTYYSQIFGGSIQTTADQACVMHAH